MEYTSEVFTLSKIDSAESEGGINYFIQSNTKVIKRYNKESLSIYEITYRLSFLIQVLSIIIVLNYFV